MVQLVLIRHAEADTGLGASDHARALTERGRRRAREMAAWLAEQLRGRPQALLCSSTARRASSTGEAVARALDIGLETHRSLYLATPEQLLETALTQQSKTLILVAHNPGLSAWATELLHSPIGMAPGDALILSVADDWSHASLRAINTSR